MFMLDIPSWIKLGQKRHSYGTRHESVDVLRHGESQPYKTAVLGSPATQRGNLQGGRILKVVLRHKLTAGVHYVCLRCCCMFMML